MSDLKPKPPQRRPYSPEEIEANKYIYEEYFEMDLVKAINKNIMEMVERDYFRSVFIDFEALPERNNPERPVILASNHSGMAFPWDAMVFGCGMYRQFDYQPKKLFRALTAPMLSQNPFMHPYFMDHAWKRAGGIDATYLNFETMMEYPEGHLLIYPEGVPGIGKGFNRKYQLQRFASSFIRMSLQHKTDIVWFSTVNAEYVAPLMFSHKGINRLVNKFGMPFLPLGPLTLLLIFPVAFYLSFPANMHFVMGRRMRPYEWTDKPYEEMTEDEIMAIRDRVHAMAQEDLDLAVQNYGKKPYKWGSFFARVWRKFPYSTPLGWPFLFHELERQWFKKKAVKLYTGWGSIFVFIFRNPITLAYYLPIIGWFILVAYGAIKWKRNLKKIK